MVGVMASLEQALARDGEVALQWGHNVRAAREELGFTRNHLAQLTDTRPESIFRFETGARLPSDFLKCAIAVALDTPVADLFPLPAVADINSYMTEGYHLRRAELLAKVSA